MTDPTDKVTTEQMIWWLKEFMPLKGGMIEAVTARLTEHDALKAEGVAMRRDYKIVLEQRDEALVRAEKAEAEVERLNTWHSTLSEAWKARAESAEAALAEAGPLLEAVEKAEIGITMGGKTWIREESGRVILRAALAYREKKEDK